MHGDRRFTEDIPQLAADAFAVSGRLCGSCRIYHSLWPYLRLGGTPGGADDRKTLIESTLAEAIATGRRRIMIAGAADTGLLSLVVRAAAGAAVDITVLDRCATPLELCRRFAERWSLPIETLHLDLMDLAIEAAFDIVFAHTVLTFILPEQRLNVLTRLRRSLRPGGRLIIRFRTKGQVETSDLSKYRDRVPSHLIDELHAMGIPLPESHDRFRQRIETYANERHDREISEQSYAEIEAMLEKAGFAITAATAVASDQSAPFSASTANVAKRLFLVVSEPR
jgi:SAM-dependent methyltransferase